VRLKFGHLSLHRVAFTSPKTILRAARRTLVSDARLFIHHKSDLRRHGVEFVSATQKVPENFAVLYEAVLDTVARIQIDQMAIDVRHEMNLSSC